MLMAVSSGLSCLGKIGVQDRWYGCVLRPKSRRCVGAVKMLKGLEGEAVAGGYLVPTNELGSLSEMSGWRVYREESAWVSRQEDSELTTQTLKFDCSEMTRF